MIWNVVLEDRLARKCHSTSMSYFLKLRDLHKDVEIKKNEGSDVFLDPEEMIHSSTTKQPSNNLGKSANYPKPLPINLSTLLPVSKNSLVDVTTAEMPPSWLQSGTLTIPGLILPSSVSPKSESSADVKGSSFVWPGIEIVIEAYRKHHQGTSLIYI